VPSLHDLRDRLRHAVFDGPGGQRYQILELIGEGGQGWVFKAAQGDAAAPFVVLKVLRPDLAKSDAFSRFEREAVVLRALSSGPSPSPHIVRFFDHGRAHVRGADGPVEVSYLVLEYIDGPPLSRVLAAHGGFGLPVARVRRILRQVARALGDLHAQNIVHRDLKPSNILLASRDASEVAKVTDFGLVKVVDGPFNQTVTMAGASAGYAPPEQYEVGNRRVGPATDVFAFGAILFEALSGCEAFPVGPGDTPLRLVARMIGDDRPALTRVSATLARELRDRPDVTTALDREIARAIDGDPGRRHASIAELWDAVEPLLRAVTGITNRPSEPSIQGPSASAPNPSSHHASVPSPAALGGGSRVIGKPLTGERLRGATFTPDARGIVAVGAYGLYHFTNGVWSALRAPRGVDPANVRGLGRLHGGDLLLYGDGLAVRMAPSGQSSSIDPAAGDVAWLGAQAGEAGAVRDIDGAARLHAAARLDAGVVLVCGTHGALFAIDAGEVLDVAWGRTGHLYAAASAHGGGAFVVGSGGHALSIVAPHPLLRGVAPPATLEAVQTTRDLTAVIVTPSGAAVAAGAQGRLLVRQAGTWSRVSLEATTEGIVAIAARAKVDDAASGRRASPSAPAPASRLGEVIALAEDGAVIEVPLA
jgi:serine/threonine protein kinase